MTTDYSIDALAERYRDGETAVAPDLAEQYRQAATHTHDEGMYHFWLSSLIELLSLEAWLEEFERTVFAGEHPEDVDWIEGQGWLDTPEAVAFFESLDKEPDPVYFDVRATYPVRLKGQEWRVVQAALHSAELAWERREHEGPVRAISRVRRKLNLQLPKSKGSDRE